MGSALYLAACSLRFIQLKIHNNHAQAPDGIVTPLAGRGRDRASRRERRHSAHSDGEFMRHMARITAWSLIPLVHMTRLLISRV